MLTSTPATSRDNLRRSIFLKDVTNLTDSKTKRLNNVINQSPITQAEVDDELERSMRRNEADIQKRLSNISTPSSPKLGDKEIRNHFQICLKMFAENKISAKNAWNLKIIDYMRTVLTGQGLAKDSLQVASTSLDVSAKIYGIRVDDIHAEGLKLASNMARVSAQRSAVEDNEDDAANEQDDDNTKENQPPKKKKRRMFGDQKTTVAKDPNSLLCDVVKLESAFFQTGSNLQSSVIDNLFTNKLRMNHGGYKFMLLSKEIAWPQYENKDSKINFEKKYQFSVNEIKNMQICAHFNDFEIDEWDPDQEEQLLGQEKEIIPDEVVYDNEGIPIPELDGSVPDLFANGDADINMYESSEDEHAVGQEAIVTKKLAHIIDFRPEQNGVRPNDYSYSTSIDIGSNKRLMQIWAGPSHWKLKHIRRTISRFSGQREKQAEKPTKRTKVQNSLFDFNADNGGFDRTKLYKMKRFRIDELAEKCTLPLVIHSKLQRLESLMLRPVLVHVTVPDNEQDLEVKSYNYENPNDSMYCSQNSGGGIDNEGDGGIEDDGDRNLVNEEFMVEPHGQQDFLGENLIDAPDQVPKTYITYALQAKRMDMKKLKVAVWKSLVSKTPNELISDDDMYKRKVPVKMFSDIYKNVSLRLTDNMRQELSYALAFVGILHLANEQNLCLTGQPNLKDFKIEQMNNFVS